MFFAKTLRCLGKCFWDCIDGFTMCYHVLPSPAKPQTFRTEFSEEKSLDLLLQWLLMPDSLVQQALSVRAPLCCWADFRGTGLGDELEKLLKCLHSLELKVERLYLAANNITQRPGSGGG